MDSFIYVNYTPLGYKLIVINSPIGCHAEHHMGIISSDPLIFQLQQETGLRDIK